MEDGQQDRQKNEDRRSIHRASVTRLAHFSVYFPSGGAPRSEMEPEDYESHTAERGTATISPAAFRWGFDRSKAGLDGTRNLRCSLV